MDGLGPQRVMRWIAPPEEKEWPVNCKGHEELCEGAWVDPAGTKYTPRVAPAGRTVTSFVWRPRDGGGQKEQSQRQSSQSPSLFRLKAPRPLSLV